MNNILFFPAVSIKEFLLFPHASSPQAIKIFNLTASKPRLSEMCPEFCKMQNIQFSVNKCINSNVFQLRKSVITQARLDSGKDEYLETVNACNQLTERLVCGPLAAAAATVCPSYKHCIPCCCLFSLLKAAESNVINQNHITQQREHAVEQAFSHLAQHIAESQET